MENVPGMRKMLGVDIARRIAREASALRYNIRVFLLNAAWFGGPQQRWRLFFVGLRQDLGPYAVPQPPTRTHTFGPDLPEGMTIPGDDDLIIWGSALPYVAKPAPAVTVREALDDLPRQSAHLLGAKPVDEPLPLRGEPSEWARELRKWPGRPAPEMVTGNWYRHTPRDFRLFREMASGDRYPQALAIAHRLFLAYLDEQRAKGKHLQPGSTAYESARRVYIPPYRNDAFDDKWGKLRPANQRGRLPPIFRVIPTPISTTAPPRRVPSPCGKPLVFSRFRTPSSFRGTTATDFVRLAMQYHHFSHELSRSGCSISFGN